MRASIAVVALFAIACEPIAITTPPTAQARIDEIARLRRTARNNRIVAGSLVAVGVLSYVWPLAYVGAQSCVTSCPAYPDDPQYCANACEKRGLLLIVLAIADVFPMLAGMGAATAFAVNADRYGDAADRLQRLDDLHVRIVPSLARDRAGLAVELRF